MTPHVRRVAAVAVLMWNALVAMACDGPELPPFANPPPVDAGRDGGVDAGGVDGGRESEDGGADD